VSSSIHAIAALWLIAGTALAVQTPVPTLLTDPYLQLPTSDSVRVVWLTEFPGRRHFVSFGEDPAKTVDAVTAKLSRVAEDAGSWVGGQQGDGKLFDRVTPRDVWRHEAIVAGLESGERVPYRVTSIAADGRAAVSDTFTLAPLPTPGQRLRILLTSDHQLKEMTAANLQKVQETVGRVDAVFFAGDLQNIPDRASEWFDDNRGAAFFPALQGKASRILERTREADGAATRTLYRGGALIQHAPLFPVIGNHEVMGRRIPGNDLGTMFNDPRPRAVAEADYALHADLLNPQGDAAIREEWVRDNAFNTTTYEELFTLPADGPAGERYYALRFGDVYLIGLYATRIWRTPSLAAGARGKYREADSHLARPDQWGWGEFIFEDLSKGSAQYRWLAAQLQSDAFKNARYKVVMMHHPAHGLGANSMPAFADPVQIIDRDATGRIVGIRYEYPLENDLFVRDIEPMLESAGVHLVHSGHSHLWNRFVGRTGMHYLETSNVGNSYGCFVAAHKDRRNVPKDGRFAQASYPVTGDPHGLRPVLPSEHAPMHDEAGNPLPCVGSNELTVFSILDTGDGSVSSYVYDTRNPSGSARLFDRFALDGS
jgi:hypothetical protein